MEPLDEVYEEDEGKAKIKIKEQLLNPFIINLDISRQAVKKIITF